MAATRESAAARKKEPYTKRVRRRIQSLVAEPITAPEQETWQYISSVFRLFGGGSKLTIEDANVSNSFLLVDVTPTAASMVG